MSRQANGLQRMAEKVSDDPLGGWAEGFTTTEFSATAMSMVFLGTMAGARDRALAGLSINRLLN